MGIGVGPMAVAKPSTEAISTWVAHAPLDHAIQLVTNHLRFRWNGMGEANFSTTGEKQLQKYISTSGMGFCGGLILSSQTRLSRSKIQTRPAPTPIPKANCLQRARGNATGTRRRAAPACASRPPECATPGSGRCRREPIAEPRRRRRRHAHARRSTPRPSETVGKKQRKNNLGVFTPIRIDDFVECSKEGRPVHGGFGFGDLGVLKKELVLVDTVGSRVSDKK